MNWRRGRHPGAERVKEEGIRGGMVKDRGWVARPETIEAKEGLGVLLVVGEKVELVLAMVVEGGWGVAVTVGGAVGRGVTFSGAPPLGLAPVLGIL